MCEFSNELVTSGRKFQKRIIFEKSMKKSCFEKIQAKSFFFEQIQGEISHFFETNQLKT